jgi:hypothetical protein
MNLPIVSHPYYDLVLPVAGKKIKYRPFVVKEEKSLLVAMLADDIGKTLATLEEVINACTNGVISDLSKYSQVDIEYLFMMIRNKAMGEVTEVAVTCSKCDGKTNTFLNLSELAVTNNKTSNTIEIAPNTWIQLRYPSLYDVQTLTPASSDEETLAVIAKCVETITVGENSIDTSVMKESDMVDWLLQLNHIQLAMINRFIADAPTIELEKMIQCKHCGENLFIKLKGIDSFFV